MRCGFFFFCFVKLIERNIMSQITKICKTQLRLYMLTISGYTRYPATTNYLTTLAQQLKISNISSRYYN